VIHLTAMARRLGLALDLDAVDAVGRRVPVIVDVEPSGENMMEDLDDVGGFPTVFGALGELLRGDPILADGRSMAEVQSQSLAPKGCVRDRDNPVNASGAFRVVRGNLAPEGALIKRSAATAALLRHSGPAFVMHGLDEVAARTGPDSTAAPDSVLVLSGAGPVGGPGMPEWGMIPIPAPLLDRGITDMVRVTDARMSGTSYGTVFLHAAPEGAVDGPIGLVRDGDVITVDADAGVIEVAISDEEMAARRAQGDQSSYPGRGYLHLYRRHVTQAPAGCDFDFLALEPGRRPHLDEPAVGRS
jgi:dihydroxy-acid dehydratase